jgi:hypothetical protein
MKIAVNVESGGSLVSWQKIMPLQPKGFKEQTTHEKETLKQSLITNGFHEAFDVWEHEGTIYSIDGVHRRQALIELSEEGYEVPDLLPCNQIIAADKAKAALIILSRNSKHSHVVAPVLLLEAYHVPPELVAATTTIFIPYDGKKEDKPYSPPPKTNEQDDYFDEGDYSPPPKSSGEADPTITSDNYAEFSCIMLYENKVAFVSLLNKIKNDILSNDGDFTPKLEDAIMYLMRLYDISINTKK